MGVTGINSGILKKEKHFISPNPALDEINIKLFSPANEIADLVIIDSRGQKVFSKIIDLPFGKNSFVLETNNLSSGIYFIQLTSAHASYTAKLVK